MNTAVLEQVKSSQKSAEAVAAENPVIPVVEKSAEAVRQQAAEQQEQQQELMRTEWKVIAAVACLFLGLEVLFRLGGDSLSKDIAHLRSFPEIANELVMMSPERGQRVLFLGNSLTRYGVDSELFAEVCVQDYQEQIQPVKMNPDNTALADWYYGYRSYFARTSQPPDVLIIGFEGGHLRDAPSNHPDRLARYYCTLDDYPDLCRFDLKNFEEKAGWGLAYVSSAFGNRDRIQRRVLDSLIPEYRAAMDDLNQRMNRDKKPQISAEPGYQRLRELIALAEQDQVQVILAAMPVPEAYEFDAGLLEVVNSTTAQLVDCRRVPGITLPMFFDGLHMDEEAQKLYSRALAEKCGPLLKTSRQQQALSSTQ